MNIFGLDIKWNFLPLKQASFIFFSNKKKASCQKNNCFSKLAPTFPNRPRFPEMYNMAGRRGVLKFVLRSYIVIWFKIQMSSKRFRECTFHSFLTEPTLNSFISFQKNFMYIQKNKYLIYTPFHTNANIQSHWPAIVLKTYLGNCFILVVLTYFILVVLTYFGLRTLTLLIVTYG